MRTVYTAEIAVNGQVGLCRTSGRVIRYVKAAVDRAVHELLGKHLGVSVFDLLGGAVRDRVPSGCFLVGDHVDASHDDVESGVRIRDGHGDRPWGPGLSVYRTVKPGTAATGGAPDYRLPRPEFAGT